jgi:hypothetical protein
LIGIQSLDLTSLLVLVFLCGKKKRFSFIFKVFDFHFHFFFLFFHNIGTHITMATHPLVISLLLEVGLTLPSSNSKVPLLFAVLESIRIFTLKERRGFFVK